MRTTHQTKEERTIKHKEWLSNNQDKCKSHAIKSRKSPSGQYRQHKKNAENRGVEFLMSYDEWLSVWLNSGKYAERGCKTGQYVMCRYNDVGPYSIDNVRIDLAGNNTTERFKLRIVK